MRYLKFYSAREIPSNGDYLCIGFDFVIGDSKDELIRTVNTLKTIFIKENWSDIAVWENKYPSYNFNKSAFTAAIRYLREAIINQDHIDQRTEFINDSAINPSEYCELTNDVFEF